MTRKLLATLPIVGVLVFGIMLTAGATGCPDYGRGGHKHCNTTTTTVAETTTTEGSTTSTEQSTTTTAPETTTSTEDASTTTTESESTTTSLGTTTTDPSSPTTQPESDSTLPFTGVSRMTTLTMIFVAAVSGILGFIMVKEAGR